MTTLYATGFIFGNVLLETCLLLPMYITVLILLKKVFIKNASPYTFKTLGISGLVSLIVIVAHKLWAFPL